MNVILISVDALRPDHLGAYGYEKNTSPSIDEFAADSLLFENAVSPAPGTKFAFKPILTGRYAQEFENVLGIPESGEPSLAEVFADAGYTTGGFHSNGFLASEFNYDRGFNEFFGPDSWPSDTSKDLLVGAKKLARKKTQNLDSLYPILRKLYSAWRSSAVSPEEQVRQYRTAEEVNDLVFDWLDDVDEDFFLWAHYMDVHEPYIYREEYFEEVNGRKLSAAAAERARKPSFVINDRDPSDSELDDVLSLYDSEIRYVDEHIGALIQHLRQRDEECIIVLTADHGESFGEMNGRFHGEAPHWNAIDVPLVINAPAVKPETRSAYVSHRDLPQTLTELAGIDTSPFPDVDLTEPGTDSEPIFVEYLDERGPVYGVIENGWKYVNLLSKSEERLYDIQADPDEGHNVATNNANVVRKLRAKMESHMTESNGGIGDFSANEVSSEVRDNLENLGYIE